MRLLDLFPRLRSRGVQCAIIVGAIGAAASLLYAPKVIAFAMGVGTIAAAIFVHATGRDQKLKLAWHTWRNRSGQNERAKPKVFGRLDGAIDGEIYGWAVDINRPCDPAKVSVFLDGNSVGDILAVHYRADVGTHAFFFDLTDCCGSEKNGRVEVMFSNGKRLPHSPIFVDVPPKREPRHGGTVLFMHIAKTAGTTFREAMVENYTQSEVAYLYPHPPGFQPGHFELLPAEQRAKFRLVVGHFVYGIHALIPGAVRYVTVVREPVHRVISHYFYLIQTEPDITRDGESAPLPLAAMLEQGRTVNLDNLMVRCFSGVDEKKYPVGHLDASVYDLAVHHLRTRFEFVGYQNRSNEAYRALQAMFGWKPRATLDVVNKSERPAQSCDLVTRKAIEHFNRWDCLLYAEIQKMFS